MAPTDPTQPARGSVVRNFLALGAGEALARLVSFGAYVYLARALGAEGYGLISFAAGITLYLTKLADFGVETEGSKVVAKDASRIGQLAPAILAARLALTAALIAFGAAIVQLLLDEPDRSILTLYFLTLLPIAASTRWIHVGLENALPVGIYRFAAAVVMLVLSLSLVRDSADAWMVPVAIAVGDAIYALGLYLTLLRGGHRFFLRWAPATALPFLRQAAPAMVQVMLGLLLYNLDVLMLRVMRDSTAVGYYAAPYMLVSFLGNLGVTYSHILLPNMARQSADEERRRYHGSLAQALVITLPVAIGGVFVAPGIIGIGFGAEYFDHSVVVLQVLVWTVPALTLRQIVWSSLYARGRRRGVIPSYLIAVATNALLNTFFIAQYGIKGAAIATVITELAMGGLLAYCAVDDGLPLPGWARMVKAAPAGIAMAAVLFALRDAHIAIQLPAGAAAYLGVLWAQGILHFRGAIPRLRT